MESSHYEVEAVSFQSERLDELVDGGAFDVALHLEEGEVEFVADDAFLTSFRARLGVHR